MYRSHSPAQSTTSASDDEEENLNKSTYFAAPDALTITPAQWSSRLQPFPLPSVSDAPSLSPTFRLPPEILIHILKHLHSSKDLYHALLVSRAWCECSVELLWYRPNFTRLSTLVKMMRVLSRQDQTFEYARFIRRLNFIYLGSEMTDSLLSRLANCTRLERLTLINCTSITDDALARVLPSCHNLVALDLTSVGDVTDRTVAMLAAATSKLQGINLGGCKKLTDASVLALAANCPLLRRVKLSGVELITDESISALARSCPLLLEIDLQNCKLITDASVRNIWTHLTMMREMKLLQCVELTDLAFPAPPRVDQQLPGPNPFPAYNAPALGSLPPLRITNMFEHLRMLDLTACSQITDDAIEGIISVAPKIRNLVLAKCSLLTDAAVESICKLEKHLHYLHLGHASAITDRSVRSLARSCTRLRYVDFANCTELTDMSVYELCSLQKLRRIGLVRVTNLTDQAIYALGDRHATLERIHLSYCDQITVTSIHFLLQKLPKVTHLSLTGIPSFRRPELQQFCRPPPQDFNTSQRAAFCVYSGRGVQELRQFLMELFTHVMDDTGSIDEDVQYERRYDTDYGHYDTEPGDADEEDDDDDDDDAEFYNNPNIVVTRGGYRADPPVVFRNYVPPTTGASASVPHPAAVSRELAMLRDRGSYPVPRSAVIVQPHPTSSQLAAGPSRRTRGGFGQQPIIEASTSPAPSDVASNQSGGTNESTGTAFFRTYADRPTSGGARNGVMTPDLVFAEIGHGRGADPGPSTTYSYPQNRAGTTSMNAAALYGMQPVAQAFANIHSGSTMTNGHRLPVVDRDVPMDYPDPRSILVDSSNSYQHGSGRGEASPPWTGSAHHHENETRSLSSSPTSRELQESIHSALGPQSGFFEGREGDGRGRSVKRSLRNTITAAEQYASSFFFGGRGSGGGHEGSGGPATSREADSHGH
ncbi:RNI-like protein [Daedalea quercina L-15889]|uniref:RNI-like protein n=1 Tax=Daedalea quercina L-15889 TaxID=1314783 RepID=A0A165SUG4_9APHY|nr:RNI-like protein [Daedalea quercina L-15889]